MNPHDLWHMYYVLLCNWTCIFVHRAIFPLDDSDLYQVELISDSYYTIVHTLRSYVGTFMIDVFFRFIIETV